VIRMNEFLLTRRTERKLQLFLCSCCRRAYDLLPEEWRQRVVRMAQYFTAEPGVPVDRPWQVCSHAVEVAEHLADGLASEEDCENAAEAARAVSRHFGHVAAGGPSPGEDPTYDQAAVFMGSDAAAAAGCAASVLPSAAELAVRVTATSAAYDRLFPE
jgi:hypothetical protein